ncbi:MAG: formylglycine-generating enzyme family protein [Deltaproteobacteria bacterium]|nr:formylglycine-generating enzyme family protein [Deltaproteobacteria bacterium]
MRQDFMNYRFSRGITAYDITSGMLAMVLSCITPLNVHAKAGHEKVLAVCPAESRGNNTGQSVTRPRQRLLTDLKDMSLVQVRDMEILAPGEGCSNTKARTRAFGVLSADFLLRPIFSREHGLVLELLLYGLKTEKKVTASESMTGDASSAMDLGVAKLFDGPLSKSEPVCSGFSKRPLMECVPAGIYRLGLSAGEQHKALRLCRELGLSSKDCNKVIEDSDHSSPERIVYLHAYLMDRNEVSCLDYERCIEAGKCGPLSEYGRASCGNSLLPVTNVDFDEAAGYCKWMGKRLPTRDEWEAAARGIQSLTYPWGNVFRAPSNESRANLGSDGTPLWADSRAFKGSGPVPAAGGSFDADCSPFHILDMAGNAAEWTSTLFHEMPRENIGEKQGLPIVILPGRRNKSLIIHDRDLKKGKYVIKGGDFAENPVFAILALQRGWPEGIGGANFLGFRCAADLPGY